MDKLKMIRERLMRNYISQKTVLKSYLADGKQNKTKQTQ